MWKCVCVSRRWWGIHYLGFSNHRRDPHVDEFTEFWSPELTNREGSLGIPGQSVKVSAWPESYVGRVPFCLLLSCRQGEGIRQGSAPRPHYEHWRAGSFEALTAAEANTPDFQSCPAEISHPASRDGLWLGGPAVGWGEKWEVERKYSQDLLNLKDALRLRTWGYWWRGWAEFSPEESSSGID